MKVYYDRDIEAQYPDPRLHPYAGARGGKSYLDFKAMPELIETELEDFKPHERRTAVHTFYSFLRWINGGASCLQSTDCGLRPVEANPDANSDAAMRTCGRVVVIHRDLKLNTQSEFSDWLCGRLAQILGSIDKSFRSSEGVVGFSQTPSLFVQLSHGVWGPDGSFQASPGDPGFGKELLLSYWAYGDDEEQVFGNLDRVFRNLWEACQGYCKEVAESRRKK